MRLWWDLSSIPQVLESGLALMLVKLEETPQRQDQCLEMTLLQFNQTQAPSQRLHWLKDKLMPNISMTRTYLGRPHHTKTYGTMLTKYQKSFMLKLLQAHHFLTHLLKFLMRLRNGRVNQKKSLLMIYQPNLTGLTLKVKILSELYETKRDVAHAIK
jgi:ABC-type transporter Mla MlaB component